jgi:hypothetical protein
MTTAVLALTLLGLAVSEAPAVEAADKAVPAQAPALLVIDGVQVTAQSLVPAAGKAVSLPVELQATWVRTDGVPPKRVAVKLCTDWQCGVWQRVDLAVGTPDAPAPSVLRRVGAENAAIVIGSFAGGQTASSHVNTGGPQGLVGVIGTLPSRLPQAGWQFHSQYTRDHVQGGVMPTDITTSAQRFPEIIHGFAAVIVGPDAELDPLLRTELMRYLRGGGRLLIPAALAAVFRPRVDPDADPRAVLDGKAPRQQPAKPIVLDRAPALVDSGGTVLRDEERRRSLPIQVTPVHSGLLYLVETEATGIDLADAILFTHPALSTDTYNYAAPENLASHVRDVAGVWLARLAPKGLIALAIFVWGVLVFFVLRRGGGRFSWKKLGALAAVSTGLVVAIVGAGRVMRGDGEEVVIRVLTAREGADFGVEQGVRMRWASIKEDVELKAPAGTFAHAVAGGRLTRHAVAYRQLSNNTLALGLSTDRPAGVSWTRHTPTTAGLKMTWPEADGRPLWQVAAGVENNGELTFDRVLVSTGSSQTWTLAALNPGDKRTPTELTQSWDTLNEPPADRREAAVRRFASQVGQLCPVVENESHRPCAVGFRFTDEGLDIFVSLPRLGYAWTPANDEEAASTTPPDGAPADEAGEGDGEAYGQVAP